MEYQCFDRMPTVHYVKCKFLEENDLTIPWRIDVELDIQADPTQITGRQCAACASDLKRKSDDISWIRVGKTNHPTYEMIQSRNNSCTTHPIDPDDMMCSATSAINNSSSSIALRPVNSNEEDWDGGSIVAGRGGENYAPPPSPISEQKNMIEEACQNNEVGSTHANLDSWIKAAVTLSASIDEVSLMIQRKAALYISSTDTLNICFDDRMCESTEHTMTNADRSILETTVASFAAGMAKQIESLRKTVVVAGDHPLINHAANFTGKADNTASHCWASGPIGHRAGIAACLMQRLKFEIMDPMATVSFEG